MNDTGFLHRYFLNNGYLRLHKWMHYFDIYEHHFARFRGKSPTVLEIGVKGGGSLAMWKEYFGAGSHIVGIDIDPACKEHQSEDIEIHIGSQDDPNLIDHVVVENGVIDVVIDDGSHMMEHMLRTFNLLYDRISPNGVYFWSRIPTPVTGLTIRVGCVSLARSWNSQKISWTRSMQSTRRELSISATSPARPVLLLCMTAFAYSRRRRKGGGRRPSQIRCRADGPNLVPLLPNGAYFRYERMEAQS
jgi:hypothetical protein